MRKPTLASERRPGDVGALYTDFGGKGQMGSLAIRRNLRSPLSSSSPPPFWSPDRHAARHARLKARARIAAVTRRWFDAKGFIEVDPAALQASPGNETHLHGFRADLVGPSGTAREAWLHTSPEFAMKKLLAAGETQIFALTHVFRNRERTALHAPEFAMLEWYRVGALAREGNGRLRCAARARRPCRRRESLRIPRSRGEPLRAARAPERARRLPAACRNRPL